MNNWCWSTLMLRILKLVAVEHQTLLESCQVFANYQKPAETSTMSMHFEKRIILSFLGQLWALIWRLCFIFYKKHQYKMWLLLTDYWIAEPKFFKFIAQLTGFLHFFLDFESVIFQSMPSICICACNVFASFPSNRIHMFVTYSTMWLKVYPFDVNKLQFC